MEVFTINKLAQAFRQGFQKEAQSSSDNTDLSETPNYNEELAIDFNPYGMGVASASDDRSRSALAAGQGITSVGMQGAMIGAGIGGTTGKTPTGLLYQSTTGGLGDTAKSLKKRTADMGVLDSARHFMLGDTKKGLGRLDLKPVLKGGAKGAASGAALGIGLNALANLGEYGLGYSLSRGPTE